MSILSPRFYRIQFFKILRSGGSPEYIARSVFCGVFAGLTVPLLQIPVAIFIAWIFKANKTIASLSTFVSNPLSYPVFWFGALYIGSFFIPGNEQFLADCQKHFFELSFWFNLDWWELGSSTILMFITGGSILGFFLGTLAYFWTKKNVIKKRAKRLKNERLKKISKEA
jgi:uncharacterized protein (DUF2062 family)